MGDTARRAFVAAIRVYVVIPRVLGHAVGLTPLTVLVSVTAIGLLFGGFGVLPAIPLAAVVAMLLDVVLRGPPTVRGGGPGAPLPRQRGGDDRYPERGR